MLRIGALVSGGGTNLQSIINAVESGYVENCEVAAVVSSSPNAYAIKRCEEHKIECAVMRKKDYAGAYEYDTVLADYFESKGVDLIIMAGFMTVLGSGFVDRFENRIMNIHPSLIPSFCGAGFYGLKVHEAALDYGVKVTGATVHFVTKDTDAGPVITQKAVYIKEGDTPEILQKRVMEEAQHIIYPEAVRLYALGKLLVLGNKVSILD